ncbi:sulfatase-like hydrolase/transferase [Brachybacterium sp. ACRRE]|uniref:sulfatase-like hydrolase/transferase n=1 Tax=Brachybacterium sp. ACRRE TaxID=2918184 RepID=UPI001EF2F49A|nr:sulfatase-like hydrolase/transferase [Brachybacterium sp. ACRRE]MCG7311142.1 sulfatase-like hydrolase/transferase [Brachybacterium sp. ACRRE]
MNHPNVLLITVDHWFGRLLGCAGHPVIKTPTLDSLAAAGVRYERAYSESPVCVPARRSIMTGTPPRDHGDRIFQQDLPMPALPTLAQTFRDAGYQAYAVGKLHVFPQRSRIGFDDVILSEEGRSQWGVADDYERYVAAHGYAGQAFAHGMSNNQYTVRPWHLPENMHVTHWAAQQMSEMIIRRDPTRPAFWYLSFTAPHPPLVPPAEYLEMYSLDEIDEPRRGEWTHEEDRRPVQLRRRQHEDSPIGLHDVDLRAAKRAFYAQCTYVDHQLRVVIGTLREQGLLDDTVIMFTSDHGDMLGDHDLWAKRTFYEKSANVPMIVVPAAADARLEPGSVSKTLMGLQDVMPTLLDLAGVRIPGSVRGCSVLGVGRTELHGEYGEGPEATRMAHDGRLKLIYYPMGDVRQLFDVVEDPWDEHDLAGLPEYADDLERLSRSIAENAYGEDFAWTDGKRLIGLEEDIASWPVDRGLSQQRGLH